jgi:hypothetical protein
MDRVCGLSPREARERVGAVTATAARAGQPSTPVGLLSVESPK